MVLYHIASLRYLSALSRSKTGPAIKDNQITLVFAFEVNGNHAISPDLLIPGPYTLEKQAKHLSNK